LYFAAGQGFCIDLRASAPAAATAASQEGRVHNQSHWYRLIAFAPAMLLLAMVAAAASCGRSIYSSASSSSSATNTPVPGQGNFAYVTNFAAGKISEFSRDTTSGALKQIATIAAGAKNGPAGIAVDPSNKYVYAVNESDGNLYAYSIGKKGVLTPLGSVSDGANSQPEQLVMEPTTNQAPSSYLWVSDYHAHRITTWALNSAGVPTTNTTFSGSGLSGPVGMAVNSAGTVLYVADLDQGLIFWFNVNTNNGKLTFAGSIPSQGSAKGVPAMVSIDPNELFLVDGDQSNATPVVALFDIAPATGALTARPTLGTSSPQPFGMAWGVISSFTYLFTANQDTSSPAQGSIGAFLQLADGSLSTTAGVNSVNGPTDVIVDPQNAFAYSTNQGDGTIGQYTLGGSCGQVICFTATLPSIKGSSGNPGPYWMALTN
jgi:6-phosphogluconolactonase (cycloisomerase 2 family)